MLAGLEKKQKRNEPELRIAEKEKESNEGEAGARAEEKKASGFSNDQDY